MADLLKAKYGPEIPKKISKMILAVHPKFPEKSFLKDALKGYDALNLKQRAQHIADALALHLPKDFKKASKILVASIGPVLKGTESNGMAPFLYFPHTLYVSRYGLEHFEESMRAQYLLTQRFSAEFSVRAFIERYPEKSLATLEKWASDPSVHVRRLVSEGTRPRLPWASRLRVFEKDPRPVIRLLEMLRDDPEIYVRRSVANHLNDLSKDHPELLFDVTKKWMRGASPERLRLLQHALRTAVKRGDSRALSLLGYGEKAKVKIAAANISPRRVKKGGRVVIEFEIENPLPTPQRLLVDFRIHFVKSNGKANAKVFKLKAVELPGKSSIQFRKSVSLAEMTTRKHHPGQHAVDLLINGVISGLGSFTIVPG